MKIIVRTKYGLARFEPDTVVFTDSIEQATVFKDRCDAIVTAAQYRLKNIIEVEVGADPIDDLDKSDFLNSLRPDPSILK